MNTGKGILKKCRECGPPPKKRLQNFNKRKTISLLLLLPLDKANLVSTSSISPNCDYKKCSAVGGGGGMGGAFILFHAPMTRKSVKFWYCSDSNFANCRPDVRKMHRMSNIECVSNWSSLKNNKDNSLQNDKRKQTIVADRFSFRILMLNYSSCILHAIFEFPTRRATKNAFLI